MSEVMDPEADLKREIEGEFKAMGIMAEGDTAIDGESAEPESTIEPEDQSPEEMRLYIGRIRSINQRLMEAKLIEERKEAAVAVAKAEKSSATKVVREIMDELSEAVDDAPNPERYPLLDKVEPGDSEPSSDDWRDVLLETLEIPPKTVELLNDADLMTVGDLASHCEKYALTDIKGIGDGKAKPIEDALAKFWTENPQE